MNNLSKLFLIKHFLKKTQNDESNADYSDSASYSSEIVKRDKSNCVCRPTLSPRNSKLLGRQQKYCTCFKLSF